MSGAEEAMDAQAEGVRQQRELATWFDGGCSTVRLWFLQYVRLQ